MKHQELLHLSLVQARDEIEHLTSPAKSPFAGRFRIATVSASLKINMVRFSIRLSFAFFLTGSSACLLL